MNFVDVNPRQYNVDIIIVMNSVDVNCSYMYVNVEVANNIVDGIVYDVITCLHICQRLYTHFTVRLLTTLSTVNLFDGSK